jgi:hypothetical protein
MDLLETMLGARRSAAVAAVDTSMVKLLWVKNIMSRGGGDVVLLLPIQKIVFSLLVWCKRSKT